MKNIEPDYYKKGKSDVIDQMYENFGYEAAREFIRGNILKYTTRYHLKNGIEDLRKAKTYIDRLIKIELKELPGRYISNHVPAVKGIKQFPDATLYQTRYECSCGDVGKRYVKEDDVSTTCHKCNAELLLYAASENEAHDEDYNYFKGGNKGWS